MMSNRCHTGSLGFTMVEIISTIVIIGLLSAIAVPAFINMAEEAKLKAMAAGVAEYNSQEKVRWHKMILEAEPAFMVSDSAIDKAIYDEMDFDLNSGSQNDWNYNGRWAEAGTEARLTFKETGTTIQRTSATLNTPAKWTLTGDINNTPASYLSDSLYEERLAQLYDGEFTLENGDSRTLDVRNGYLNDKIIVTRDAGGKVLARKGDDFVVGGVGNDELRGNMGNDTLFGGDGNDRIYGGRGNDIMFGGNGDDTFNGQSGEDVVIYDLPISSYTITKSFNKITIQGPEGTDTITSVEFFYFGNETRVATSGLPFE